MDLDSRIFVIKIQFNLNSQGNEKLELSSQVTYDFQNLEMNLFIADYEYVGKSAFGNWLAGKLWLKALFCGMLALLNERT